MHFCLCCCRQSADQGKGKCAVRLPPGEVERSICQPLVAKGEGTSDIGSRRALHAKEPVWRNQSAISWCSASYKGSELTFMEDALSFHALWKAKALHTYTVPLVVLIFPVSAGIKAWVRAAYELLPLFMFVTFCFHYRGHFVLSPMEH